MQKEPLMNDDAVVLMYLSLVEDDGVEMEVSLNVKGVIVSGTLISASAYYDGMIESCKEMKDVTLSKIMSKKYTELKEKYLNQKKESESRNKDVSINSATFIHLKKANYLVKENGIPSSIWWRGRISSIDAVSFEYK